MPFVELSITDTGLGMTPNELKQLFLAFAAIDIGQNQNDGMADADSPFMKETKGIGLGLSTSKMLVEAQDGTISIESLAGQNTRATLSIKVETKRTANEWES